MFEIYALLGRHDRHRVMSQSLKFGYLELKNVSYTYRMSDKRTRNYCFGIFNKFSRNILAFVNLFWMLNINHINNHLYRTYGIDNLTISICGINWGHTSSFCQSHFHFHIKVPATLKVISLWARFLHNILYD